MPGLERKLGRKNFDGTWHRDVLFFSLLADDERLFPIHFKTSSKRSRDDRMLSFRAILCAIMVAVAVTDSSQARELKGE